MLTFRGQERFIVDYNVADICRDWASEDGQLQPIRIDLTRQFAADVLGFAWDQEAEIVEGFRSLKRKHREDIRLTPEVDSRNGTRFYMFGTLPDLVA
jgi:hypothetical protein